MDPEPNPVRDRLISEIAMSNTAGKQQIRYEIRSALPDDENELFDIAGHLDTVNLPEERKAIRQLLGDSISSFEGQTERALRRYTFVLVDLDKNRLAGTSMVVAKLGRRDAPYIYLDVQKEEKYSSTQDKHFEHTVLRVGYSYNGPTEIGGLIVRPEYRRSPERLGMLLSYVRFLYIAAHRASFEDELLAELLPPLEPDGTSHLWNAFGRRFTDMSYRDADRLSSRSKDFIRDLFPSGAVYATLLDPLAQAVIGEVGEKTKGVEKMLRRIGFRYAERVDPFDGGPHFVARTNDVSLVRSTVRATLGGYTVNGRQNALIARDIEGAPFFRALLAPVELNEEQVQLPEAVAERLGVEVGSELNCLPLPG